MIAMTNYNIDDCIKNIPPDSQEKANTYENQEDISEFEADNDKELSNEMLESVSGGSNQFSDQFRKGDRINSAFCPECRSQLYYWDMCHEQKGFNHIIQMKCYNPNCSSFYNEFWFAECNEPGTILISDIRKY